MQKPFFSVIVVSLNAGDEVKKTLDSILCQTYTNYEILLKDGGSTDGSITHLEREGYFEKYSCLRQTVQKDKGIYDAMNQALAEAKGKYLIFLNCGDYFFDSLVLEKTAVRIGEYLKDKKEEKRPRIFYGNQWNRLQNTLVTSSPEITNFTLYRNVPCHQVCFYHRELFAQRGYDIRYQVRADYEHFLYSVIQRKAGCCFLDEVIASYEGGGFSEKKESRIISAKEHREITEKYLGKSRCFLYRLILLLTLASLRSKIAENPKLAAGYNQIKSFLYGRKK